VGVVDAVDVGERNPEWGKWTREGGEEKDAVLWIVGCRL